MQATSTWISKRDRHMQLINSSIFDKETNLRVKAIDKTRHEKIVRRDQREKLRFSKHLSKMAAIVPFTAPRLRNDNFVAYEVIVDNIRFQVQKGGSKLFRDQGKCMPHVRHPQLMACSLRRYRAFWFDPKASSDWRSDLSSQQEWQSLSRRARPSFEVIVH